MYFHPKDEYIYYLGDCDIKQRLTDRSASHCGRFAPQTQPMGCAICIQVDKTAETQEKRLRKLKKKTAETQEKGILTVTIKVV